MGTSRVRERSNSSQIVGSYVNHQWGTTVYDSSTRGSTEYCADVVGNWEGVNPFNKLTRYVSTPSLDGKAYAADGTLIREFNSYPLGMKCDARDPAFYYGAPSDLELQSYCWRILSETNPSNAHVGIPAAVGELKDFIPSVKNWGNGLLKISKQGLQLTPSLRRLMRDRFGLNLSGAPRSAAQSFLTWQWVVNPMIGDLRKILNFQQAANNRFRELKNLQKSKRIRRRCHLGKLKGASPPNRRVLHSVGAWFEGDETWSHMCETWGTASYYLPADSKIPTMSDEELRSFAKRLTGGFTTYGALDTAWQLMPWSWLVDWFSNVDDLIGATNNSIGLVWDKIALMRKSSTRYTVKVDQAHSDDWCTLDSEYLGTCERKQRWRLLPLIPFPLPSLSILSGRQFALLGSLAVCRLSR